MKKMFLAILILMSSYTFAREINFPAVIAVKKSNSMVVFKRCYLVDDCGTIGNEEGYHVDRLVFNPSADRLKAVGLGLGEGALGLIVGQCTAFVAWASDVGDYVSRTWGMLAATAATVALPSIISEKANPFFRWRVANVKSRLSKDNFVDDDMVVVDFPTAKKMDKFVTALQAVLRNLP